MVGKHKCVNRLKGNMYTAMIPYNSLNLGRLALDSAENAAAMPNSPKAAKAIAQLKQTAISPMFAKARFELMFIKSGDIYSHSPAKAIVGWKVLNGTSNPLGHIWMLYSPKAHAFVTLADIASLQTSSKPLELRASAIANGWKAMLWDDISLGPSIEKIRVLDVEVDGVSIETEFALGIDVANSSNAASWNADAINRKIRKALQAPELLGKCYSLAFDWDRA